MASLPRHVNVSPKTFPHQFVKYLPDFGWQPVVLTVENPSVPLFDESLLGDIPSSVVVHKARTLEPSYSTKQAVSATKPT